MDYDFSTFESSLPAEVAGFIAIFALGLILFGLIIAILTIIINWKLLTKMGDEGWKAIIPVYNVWSLCEGVGLTPHWGWIVVVATPVCNLIPGIGVLLGSAIILYFNVIFCISIARSFGKSDGFGILLFFFYPIVGFILLGSDYIGKQPCHDFVFDELIKLDKKENTTQSNTTSTANQASQTVSEASVVEENKPVASKYCSSCGKQIDGDAKFCTNCGNQVNS